MKQPDIREYLATEGRVIRDPKSRARVPHAGAPIRVRFSSYWMRRELDGDVFTPSNQSTETAPSKRNKATSEG